MCSGFILDSYSMYERILLKEVTDVIILISKF